MEHVDELISGQALHALSPDEEEQVALHVAECERCRRQLRESEAVAASLAYAVPAVAPPPDLRRRVLEAVAPVVEAPAAAVPARARRDGPRAGGRGSPPSPCRRSRPPSSVWSCGTCRCRATSRACSTRSSTARAGNLRGVGNVIVKPNGNATLFASVAPAPAGKTYEAWVIRGKVALPAGIFKGGGTVNLTLSQDARPGDVIAITIEPAGGTKAPTTTPIANHRV